MSEPNNSIIHIPTSAVQDICMYVEDLLARRPLTEEEKHALSIKVRFWIHMTQCHGQLLVLTEDANRTCRQPRTELDDILLRERFQERWVKDVHSLWSNP